MGCFEGSGVPVLYIGRTVPKGEGTFSRSLAHSSRDILYISTDSFGTALSFFSEVRMCQKCTILLWILFVRLDEERIYKRNVDTPDELLARILDDAGCIKTREEQLRRTTRDLRTRVAKCTEVGDGIFGHLL